MSAEAKQLLEQTDLPMPEVAGAAGFGSPEYLAQVFRAELNCTPLRYRKASRTQQPVRPSPPP